MAASAQQLALIIRMVIECLLAILLNLPWFRHAYLRFCRTAALAKQSVGLPFPTALLHLPSLRHSYLRFCGNAALYVKSLGSPPPNVMTLWQHSNGLPKPGNHIHRYVRQNLLERKHNPFLPPEVMLFIAMNLKIDNLVRFRHAGTYPFRLFNDEQTRIIRNLLYTDDFRVIRTLFGPPLPPPPPPPYGARELYDDTIPESREPTSEHFYKLHYRYITARILAKFLAKLHFSTVTASTIKKHTYYLLVITHYLECCLQVLASYGFDLFDSRGWRLPTPFHRTQNIVVDHQMVVLVQFYGKNFLHRRIGCFFALVEDLYSRLQQPNYFHLESGRDSEKWTPGGDICRLVFFGGMEAMTDIITAPSVEERLAYVNAHLIRANIWRPGTSRPTNLPSLRPPVVDPLEPQEAWRVQDLIPRWTGTTSKSSWSIHNSFLRRGEHPRKWPMARFNEYLVSDEDDEVEKSPRWFG